MLFIFGQKKSDGGSSTPTTELPLTKYLGDGSDGNVTITNGQTVTLTKDMTYTNLTVETGGTLDTAGFRVYATGTITAQIGSIIKFTVPAPAGSGTTVVPTLRSTGVISTGIVGLQAAGPGTQVNTALYYGGDGGNGGNNGSGSGGVGRGIVNETTRLSSLNNTNLLLPSPISRLPWKRPDLAVGVFFNGVTPGGGAGGGAGAGQSSSVRGGTGGTGGGVVFLAADVITLAGTLFARGRNGADSPATTGSAGGGGGGGGGLIVINCHSLTDSSATYDVSAGLGGAGFGSGAAGSAGSVGTVIKNVWT